MKCPNCNRLIKTINEISVNTQTKLSDKNWYKLKEEISLTCPACKIKLKLKASKELKIKLTVFYITFISLALAAFFYSTIAFIIITLIITITSTPIINYILYNHGELTESNT